jgi:uncharacterized protein
MGKQKSLSGAGNFGASIGQGASIANMANTADAATPSQYDNDAELFTSFSKAFSRPGDRPRGLLNNLGAGMAEGAAYGARSKAIAEKKGKNEKFQKFMDYFQQANQSAVEQNKWYEKREAAKSEMMPQVLAYMDNIDKLDPQSQRIMAQDMLAQYGEALGENFKLSSIDGSNPFLMTIQSDKGQQLFDLRSMFAGDAAMQQSISMKMPEYQMKLQEERQNKQREFDMKEKELKAKYPNYGKEYGEGDGQEDYGSIPLDNIKKGGGGRAFMNTINAEMNLAKDIPVILDQLKEAELIIKDNPSLGTGWNNYLSKGSFTKGLMDEKTRVAYETLEKIASRVEEAYIRAKGTSITDSERETIKKGLFQTTNKGQSNKYNINSVRKELAIALERGNFAGDELVRGRVATPQSFRKYQEAKKMQKDSTLGNDEWDSVIWRPSQ